MAIGGPLPTQRSNGIGDIRWSYKPGVRFGLRSLRCHFVRVSGSGTSTATLTIDADCQRGTYRDSEYDVRLYSSTGSGVSADVNMTVDDESIERLALTPDYALQVNWTNPDSIGEISWSLEAECVSLV